MWIMKHHRDDYLIPQQQCPIVEILNLGEDAELVIKDAGVSAHAVVIPQGHKEVVWRLLTRWDDGHADCPI